MRDRFSFDLEVLKADEREGRRFITIYATDTAPDKEGERCSNECLTKMAAAIKAGGVELLNSHKDAIGFGRGVDAHVVDAAQFGKDLTGHQALLVDVELDPDYPQSKSLFDEARSGSCNKEFSIGGFLNKANPKAFYFERGKRVFNDLVPDHIAVARRRRAANDRTHISSAVMKSLDMTPDDIRELSRTSAPYTVRDLAAKLGLKIQKDVVEKQISTAYFEGETEEAGPENHSHRFYARLSGELGTLIGTTTSWSAGGRHAHLIDLLDDETADTSGASRGEAHAHSLGMGTVRQITQESFETAVNEAAKLNPLVAKLLAGTMETVMESQTDKTSPTTATAPASVAESPAVAPVIETPKVEALSDEEIGFVHGLKEMFSGKKKTAPLPQALTHLADQVTADYAQKGGNMDELAKASIYLMQRVAGVQVDRDGLSMRSAKLVEAIESVGALRKAEKPVIESATTTDDGAPKVAPIDAGKGEQPKVTAPVGTAPENDKKETDMDMTPAQMDELVAKLAPKIAPSVSEAVIGAFRSEGLLPKVAPAGEVKVEPAAPAAEAPKTTPAAVVTEPKKDEPVVVKVDDTQPKITEALVEITKTLSGINDRLATVEKTPASGSRSMRGQDDPTKATKKGTFTGVIQVPAAARGRR